MLTLSAIYIGTKVLLGGKYGNYIAVGSEAYFFRLEIFLTA